MRKYFVNVLFAAFILFFIGMPVLASGEPGDKILEKFTREIKPAEPLLDPQATVEDVYRPGEGKEIGTVEFVQGVEAYIQHKGERKAYKAQKGVALYMGDALIAGDKAKMTVRLNDKSAFTLSSFSKIVLDRVVFNAAKGTRDSQVSLPLGRANFKVAKITGGDPNFTVRTPGAVVGVRGSEFLVGVLPEEETRSMSGIQRFFSWLNPVQTAHAAAPALATIVAAGANTSVGVTGLTGATQVLTSLTMSTVAAGQAATAPLAISAAAFGSASSSIGAGVASMSMPSHMDR